MSSTRSAMLASVAVRWTHAAATVAVLAAAAAVDDPDYEIDRLAVSCPAGYTLMASTSNFTACEDHRSDQHWSSRSRYTTANNSYVPPPDVTDPTLHGVMGEKQPMIHVGSLDKFDPKNCEGVSNGCKSWHPTSPSGWDVHTFVGSRGSSVKASFDSLGSDVNGFGYPDMNQWPDKYGRSSAVFKDLLNKTDQHEGLWGSHLPVVTMFHSYLAGAECSSCSVPPSPCPGKPGHTFCSENPAPHQCDQPPCHLGKNSGSGWIEWTAVPVADMEGSQQQDVYFRVTKVDSNGTIIDARYFDTFALLGSEGTDLPVEVNDGALVQGMGSSAGSAIAADFYSEVLNQRNYWEATLAREGIMKFSLPGADGLLLRDQAVHVVVRDMISRHDFFWPKYGILPGLYGEPGNDGCPLTIYWSLVGALEMGAFEYQLHSIQYAKGVLHNWLQYFTRKRGYHRRGGLSNTQAFMDELVAKYVYYTGDTEIVLRFFDKIMMPSTVNRALITRAKKLGPSHKAFGIPAVNDNGDLWATGVECGTTFGMAMTAHEYDGTVKNNVAADCHITMPWYDSALNTALGWKELGPLLVQIGGHSSRPDIIAEGKQMIADSEDLIANIATSLDRSKGVKTDRMKTYNITCYPGWAGGPIPPHDNICGSGSQYKFPSRDMCSGCSAGPLGAAPNIFTSGEYHGTWQNSMMEDDVFGVIRQVFSSSAFSMTRGTWTSAEVPSSGPDQIGTGVSPWVGMQHAASLKSLLVWNDPRDGMPLWIGKAIPRAWLAEGERIDVQNATTRWGRLSFSIEATSGAFTVSLVLPPSCCESGVKVRIRAPSPKRLVGATVGGKPAIINVTEETVLLPSTLPPPSDLANIVVKVA